MKLNNQRIAFLLIPLIHPKYCQMQLELYTYNFQKQKKTHRKKVDINLMVIAMYSSINNKNLSPKKGFYYCCRHRQREKGVDDKGKMVRKQNQSLQRHYFPST